MSTLMQHQTRSRVLCIDDDPGIPAAIAARLRNYNVDVVPSFFGTQGIWTAVMERPDAIITDLRMPQGQGAYVVECLKGRVDTRDIPVIVLTGNRDADLQRWMLALGVVRYLHKPLGFEELLDTLRDVLQLKLACTA